MTKVLVFVHGAGKADVHYADDTLAEIALLLGWEPPCVPVYYADIGNVGTSVNVAGVSDTEPPPATPEPPQVTQFKTSFKVMMQEEYDQHNAQKTADGQTVSVESSPLQSLAELATTEINQVAGYLFNPVTFHRIQARMRDGLATAAQMGDTLVIVSHSLGTLVAFDTLAASGAQYPVSTFFTLGSPLAKLRRLGSRAANLGAITPENVRMWQNWYDNSDPISGLLGLMFPQPGYRLHDVFVNNAPHLPDSHDYLNNREVLAAIADAMR